MMKKIKIGNRCPHCGWHITPISHPDAFGADATGYYDWTQCKEQVLNTEYLAKYKYNEENGQWEE